MVSSAVSGVSSKAAEEAGAGSVRKQNAVTAQMTAAAQTAHLAGFLKDSTDRIRCRTPTSPKASGQTRIVFLP